MARKAKAKAKPVVEETVVVEETTIVEETPVVETVVEETKSPLVDALATDPYEKAHAQTGK